MNTFVERFDGVDLIRPTGDFWADDREALETISTAY